MTQELNHSDQPAEVLGPYLEGEAPGVHQHTFLNADGDPINVTGWTVVWVQGRISDPIGSAETKAGSVVDGPAGLVQVVFGAEAFDVPGEYYGRFWAYQGPSFSARTAALASHLFSFIVRDDPLPPPSP